MGRGAARARGRAAGRGHRSPSALDFRSLVLAVPPPPVTEHPGDASAAPSPSSLSRAAPCPLHSALGCALSPLQVPAVLLESGQEFSSCEQNCDQVHSKSLAVSQANTPQGLSFLCSSVLSLGVPGTGLPNPGGTSHPGSMSGTAQWDLLDGATVQHQVQFPTAPPKGCSSLCPPVPSPHSAVISKRLLGQLMVVLSETSSRGDLLTP